MRGANFCTFVIFVKVKRIIPACAGQTFSAQAPLAHPSDHPRMRGANAISNSESYKMYGSSPHARGKRRSRYQLEPHGRIIPACAGQTAYKFCHMVALTDHPRMRGANVGRYQGILGGTGSSPHARGKPF